MNKTKWQCPYRSKNFQRMYVEIISIYLLIFSSFFSFTLLSNLLTVSFHGQMADCFKPELEWSVDDPITSESSIDGATCPTVTLSSMSETGSQPPTNESSIDGKTNKIGTQPPSFSNPCPGTSKLGLENLSGKARRALIRVSVFTVFHTNTKVHPG